MHLSLLKLNPRSRQVQAELRDPYQMHRTFSKAFGEADAFKKARCLFRVDESTNGELFALVQSKSQPDWASLANLRGYLNDKVEYKSVTPAIKDGQALRFRLRANPSVKRDGKRIGIYVETERLAWLQRKASKNGFDLLEARVISDGKQKGIKTDKHSEQTHATVHSAAIFNGVLRVTDSQAFLSALENGIGSAKGFGFGLLSVAPLRR